MKANFLLAAPFALAITACNPNSSTLGLSGIDPLRPPSSGVDKTSYGTELRPGQFVTAVINNTAFYKNKPKEDQSADSLLAQGTPMKIVALSGGFTKVELDSGEVGFVPTAMISTGQGELTPLDGAIDEQPIIIPVDGDVPLPVLDPTTAAPIERSGLPPKPVPADSIAE